MPYFSSLQQFLDTVTARLTKPKRGVGGSEGVLATDVLEALKDTGKYTDDMRVVAQTVLATFNAVYDPALNAANQAALSAAAAQALVTGVSTARPSIRPSLLLDFANARAVDPRISFTRNSIGTYFDAQGVLRTAAVNQPRITFDPITGKCLGLLIEESRTNSIRNSTMQGAVVGVIGSGGVVPTNWDATIGGGLSMEIVAVNTEGGALGMVIRLFGTTNTTSATLLTLNWEGNTNISAGNNQPWAISSSIKLVGGGMTGINTIRYRLNIRNTGGGAITTLGTNNLRDLINSTNQRFTDIITTEPSNVGYIQPLHLISGFGVSGQSIDITLRFSIPQAEQGAFATSYIPTSTVAVTRQADVAQIAGTNFSDLYNQSEGTLYAEGLVNTAAQDVRLLTLSATSYQIGLRRSSSNTCFAVFRDPNNMDVALSNAFATGILKMASAYKKNDIAGVYNGGSVTTGNSYVPMANTVMHIGQYNNGTGFLNGPVACVAYWPKRLSNTELQAITANGLLSGKNPNQLPTAGDLGSAAFESLPSLLMRPNRQEFQVEGTGSSRTITIRRPYDFQFALVDATGSTVTAQPSATCVANTNYSLTFNAPVGTLLTYAITPIFYS